MRRFHAVVFSAALVATACTAGSVPSSTDTTIATHEGLVQVERQAPAEQPAQAEQPRSVITSNPPRVDRGSSRSPELPPKIVPPSPGAQPAPAQTGRPGPDRCSRGGSGDPKIPLMMCIAQ